MFRHSTAASAIALLLAACAGTPSSALGPASDASPPATTTADALASAIGGDWRSPANAARDQYRHPRETLAFFGVSPAQTVIEITPGAGWYSEILVPYLRAQGHYVAAVQDDTLPKAREYIRRGNERLRGTFAARPDVYGQPELRAFDPAAPAFGQPASADVVLTFRNAHNWVADGNAQAYFQAFFDVLRPGGVLGVVDHRAKPGTNLEEQKASGYLTEELVIGLATAAGFVLDAKSEVNANPADNADHPNGVWTLPPNSNHDAADAAKYKAIGESDRMTLRFVKPGA